MYILSLDTTAKTAAVAVCTYHNNDFAVKSVAAFNTTLTHSESLMPMIDFCLKGANITFDDVEICAVSRGPGSFTGVRIGISALKGLCFGKNKKCVGVSALGALAKNVDDAKRSTLVCSCMDARRNQFYNALFIADGKGALKRLCEDRAISADELYEELVKKHSKKHIIVVGDGAYLACKLLTQGREIALDVECAREDLVYQNAVSVAREAVVEYTAKAENVFDDASILPTYLRQSQAERERNERLRT